MYLQAEERNNGFGERVDGLLKKTRSKKLESSFYNMGLARIKTSSFKLQLLISLIIMCILGN
jgi:hypothetical protein